MRGFSYKSSAGFTLVELLVVLAIIALLMTIGLASYGELMKRSRDTRRESDLKRIQAALQQYYADRSFYPACNTPTTCAGLPLRRVSGVGQLDSETNDGDAAVGSSVRVYLSPTQVPIESLPGYPYCYIAVPAGCNNVPTTSTRCQSYALFAKLEGLPADTKSCGSTTNYNYVVTSP